MSVVLGNILKKRRTKAFICFLNIASQIAGKIVVLLFPNVDEESITYIGALFAVISTIRCIYTVFLIPHRLQCDHECVGA